MANTAANAPAQVLHLPTRKATARTWSRRLLTAAALGFLVRTTVVNLPTIREAWHQLFASNGSLIALALGLEVAWTYALSNVYRRALLAQGGSMSAGQALRVSMGAFSLSRILPGGGAAGSVFAAREMVRIGNDASSTVCSMVVSWWISMTTLAGLVSAGTALGMAAGVVAPAYLLGPAAVLGALLAAGAAGWVASGNERFRHRINSGLGAIARRFGLTPSERAWASPAAGGRRFAPVAGWSLAGWAADAAALWVVFAAFGEILHPGVLVVGYGLANLINALPELTPGWLGVLESALAVAYAALGVPAGVALMAVLSYRLISFWLPVAAGLAPGWKMLRAAPVAAPAAERWAA